MLLRHIAPLSIIFLTTAAFAQATSGEINAVKIEPAAPQTNQVVKVTVTSDGELQPYCGLRIDFGDGEIREIKMGDNDAKFPITVDKTYTKPGTYIVRTRGTTIKMRGRCQGKAEATVTVTAAAGTATPCPADYKLKGKVGKSGDFTCTAGKGAKKPEKVLECKQGLEYFQSKTTLGCRKVKAAKK